MADDVLRRDRGKAPAQSLDERHERVDLRRWEPVLAVASVDEFDADRRRVGADGMVGDLIDGDDTQHAAGSPDDEMRIGHRLGPHHRPPDLGIVVARRHLGEDDLAGDAGRAADGVDDDRVDRLEATRPTSLARRRAGGEDRDQADEEDAGNRHPALPTEARRGRAPRTRS